MSSSNAPFAVLCDLDGVVWLDHRPLPGAVEALARLEEAGSTVVYVTNNSMSTRAEHEAALSAIGVESQGRVVSSPMAAATLLEGGERVLVIGGAGIVEAVESSGCEILVSESMSGDDPVDVVMVGLDRRFDYERLERASRAVRGGARLIGTNADPTFPTPRGQVPGGGAILAAIATAADAVPEIAGKPHAPMAAAVAHRLGCGVEDLAQAVMVGDRRSTDGAFAQRLGCRFALVGTGVTALGSPTATPTWLEAADLAGVVEVLVGS